MVNLDVYLKKYDEYIALNNRHPAFLEHITDYLAYTESHLAQIGVKKGPEMYDALIAKTQYSTQELVVRQMCMEMNRIGRSFEIQLNRYPLRNYIYLRSIAIDFLRTVKLVRFIDPMSTILSYDPKPYLEVLQKLVNKMQVSSDYYDVYVDLKQTVVRCLGNGVLTTKHIAPYVPLIIGFEKDVIQTSKRVSLREETPSSDVELDQMDAFGASNSEDTSLLKNGRITLSTLQMFLEKGSSFVYDLLQSKSFVENDCAQALRIMYSAQNYDPICHFVRDKEDGIETILAFCKDEVLTAQKMCQSILNIFTPELLMQTALSTFIDSKFLAGRYDKQAILEEVMGNLTILQEYGIITYETQQSQFEKIKAELEG